MTGQIDDISVALGRLQGTVEAMASSHQEKAKADAEFRRTMYEIVPVVKSTAATVEKHDGRLDRLESLRNKLLGAVAVLSTGGAVVGNKIAALFSGGGGQ